MPVIKNLELGSLAYVELIIDWVPPHLRVPGEPENSQWYVVHIEPAQQEMVQTIQMTVTVGYLNEFLTEMGWTFESQDLRIIHQHNK